MNPYKITERIQETPDVISLKLVDKNGGHPRFIAGQCVTIFLPDSDVPSGKAYSLSSAPSDQFFSITVKKVGDYSSRIHELKVDDEVLMSEPYGFFNPEFDDAPMVMIAGGVGIAPIMSIIKDALEHDRKRKVELWYSNRTVNDIVFKNELNELAKNHQNFHVRYFITREKVLPDGYVARRICAADILSAQNRDPETFYFMCGREDFVKNIWRGLINSGISESQIATEAFL